MTGSQSKTQSPLSERLTALAEKCDEFWPDGFDVGDVSALCTEASGLLREAIARIRALEAERDAARRALQHWYPEAGCPVCSGDCGSANPPVIGCPMQEARRALVPQQPGGGA
jgi:hypothetical protein